jgi:hypothetical protein
MVPALQLRIVMASRLVVGLPTAEVAWVNQATWHHGHFGLKSAPRHRDFRPAREEVI